MCCRHRDTIYVPKIYFLPAGLPPAFPFAAGSSFLPKEPKRPAFFAGAGGGGGGVATVLGLPLKRVSRYEAGIIDPGQLNGGIAWMDVCSYNTNVRS